MKIDFGLNVLFYIAAVMQGCFTAVLLLSAKVNRLPNRLLALLMLAIAGWLIDGFLRASNIYSQHADLYFLPIYYSFAFGPLVYFYVLTLVNRSFSFRPIHLVHFIPVIVQAAFYWIVTFQSYHTKYLIWFNVHRPYTYRLEYDGTWLSIVLYSIASYKHIKGYQAWLANNYTDVVKKRLRWLKLSFFVLILICAAWLFEAILRDSRNIYYKYDVSGTLLCVIMYIIGIMGYQQAAVNLSFVKEAPAAVKETAVTEVNSQIIAAIEHALGHDRLYLNPELTLSALARHIGYPPKTVSAQINAHYRQSFSMVVNAMRVEEIKRRLRSADVQQFTLLGLAYESGFNSKTSFNRIFKEFTGKAPSEFLLK